MTYIYTDKVKHLVELAGVVWKNKVQFISIENHGLFAMDQVKNKSFVF